MALSASRLLFQSVFWGPVHGHLWATWFCLLSMGGALWESGLFRTHREPGTWCLSSGSCSSVPDPPDSPCFGASALSAQRTAALSHGKRPRCTRCMQWLKQDAMDLAWASSSAGFLLHPKMRGLAGLCATCSLKSSGCFTDLFEIAWCFSTFPATEEQTQTQAENKSWPGR